jgi:hypothetical protein
VIRNWRWWVLVVLLTGPILAYMGFGALWLYEHGWLLVVGIGWFATGIVFTVLAARWTKSPRELLPPIDWDAPRTFSKFDRDAWLLVEAEADRADSASMEALSDAEIYFSTGRRLARTLAEHYHPLATDPLENVPVVDMLTAFELAAEDLAHLCHQVPGGDLITPSHWKKAVQVAGYLQRANDIYSFLLPVFNPVSGLVRLGTQQLISRPQWKSMQQNLLRWFFRAFVNRLGLHLIELYSGRLSIGAAHYRRLTRRMLHPANSVAGEVPPPRIAVVGARDAGKSRLIELLEHARSADSGLLKARLEGEGIDPMALDALKGAEWFEVPGYTADPTESARNRATRQQAVEQAVEADLLLLVVDARRNTAAADAAFAQAWDRWFVEHPALEIPPALAVLTALDDPALGGEWKPPYDWKSGQGPREAVARARVNALRPALPPSFGEVIGVGLAESQPFGVVELLLPSLIALFHRAERAALLHHLRKLTTRSKASRLLSQVGEHGRSLWGSLRARGKTAAPHHGGAG